METSLIIIITLSIALSISTIAFLFLILKIYVHSLKGICKTHKHLVGKVVIVTGANCGIGYATALDLAERGARVIITTIDDALGMEARDKIIAESGNKDVHYYFLDLSSFDSVRKFADGILKTETQLNVLINNAGVFFSKNAKTKDGILLGLQINYFGPFLLTNLLLPLLKSSAPSRIINVASSMHKGTINFKDITMENASFSSPSVYRTSKLYTVTITGEMARRLKGTGVTVNCVHPGMVKTQIALAHKIYNRIYNFLTPLFMHFIKTPEEGAQTTIYLAVSPQVDDVSGCYFSDCRVEKTISPIQDHEVGSRLWEMSEKIVGSVSVVLPSSSTGSTNDTTLYH